MLGTQATRSAPAAAPDDGERDTRAHSGAQTHTQKGAHRPQSPGVRVPERIGTDDELGCQAGGWIRPPMASIAFRHQAWRNFEHALDLWAHPALSPRRSQAVGATLRVSKTPVRRENESFPSESEALRPAAELAFRLQILISRNANRVLTPTRPRARLTVRITREDPGAEPPPRSRLSGVESPRPSPATGYLTNQSILLDGGWQTYALRASRSTIVLSRGLTSSTALKGRARRRLARRLRLRTTISSGWSTCRS
jgi:hypothetical protein